MFLSRCWLAALVVFGCESLLSAADGPHVTSSKLSSEEIRIRTESATKTRLELRQQLGRGSFGKARESAWVLESLSAPLLDSGDITAEVDASLREDVDRLYALAEKEQQNCKDAWDLRREAAAATQHGDYSRSVELLLSSRELFKVNLGKESVFTVEAGADLSYALNMVGDADAAADVAKENIAITEHRFGRDHLQSILAYDCYATAIVSKDIEKATRIQIDNLKITERRCGIRSTWRTTIACNLAEIYLRRSDFVHARELLVSAEPMFEEGAPYHQVRDEFLYELSVLLLGEGDAGLAIEKLDEAKQLPGRIYPPDSVVSAEKFEHESKLAKSRGMDREAAIAAARATKIYDVLKRERREIDEVRKRYAERKTK